MQIVIVMYPPIHPIYGAQEIQILASVTVYFANSIWNKPGFAKLGHHDISWFVLSFAQG